MDASYNFFLQGRRCIGGEAVEVIFDGAVFFFGATVVESFLKQLVVTFLIVKLYESKAMFLHAGGPHLISL